MKDDLTRDFRVPPDSPALALARIPGTRSPEFAWACMSRLPRSSGPVHEQSVSDSTVTVRQSGHRGPTMRTSSVRGMAAGQVSNRRGSGIAAAVILLALGNTAARSSDETVSTLLTPSVSSRSQLGNGYATS